MTTTEPVLRACPAKRCRESEAVAGAPAWLRRWASAAGSGGALGLESVLIVGSGAGKRSGDIDLLCLTARLDRDLFDRLAGSLRAGVPAGTAARIETRIGPVWQPGAGQETRLHLLIHDRASWRATSPVSRCLCMGLGTRLWGRPPARDPFAPPGPPAIVGDLLRRDLGRLGESLSRRAAPVRHWRFDPEARLVEAWMPASAPPRFAKLCRYVASMLRGWALLLPAWDPHPSPAGGADELARIAALAAAGEADAAARALALLCSATRGRKTR